MPLSVQQKWDPSNFQQQLQGGATPPYDRPLESKGLGPGDYLLNYAMGAGPFMLALGGIIDLASDWPWKERFKEVPLSNPEQTVYHGIDVRRLGEEAPTELEQRLKGIAQKGIQAGYFSETPYSRFGPFFVQTQLQNLPQPIIRRAPNPWLAKPEDLIELLPNWSKRKINPDLMRRAWERFYNRDIAEWGEPGGSRELGDWVEPKEFPERQAAFETTAQYGYPRYKSPMSRKMLKFRELPPDKEFPVIPPEQLQLFNPMEPAASEELSTLARDPMRFRDLIQKIWSWSKMMEK